MNRYHIRFSESGVRTAHFQYAKEAEFYSQLKEFRSQAIEWEAEDCWAKLKEGEEVDWWTIGDSEEVKFDVLLNTDLIHELPVQVECRYNVEHSKMELCAAKVMYNILHGCDIAANLTDEAIAKFEAEAEKQIVHKFLEGHTTTAEL
jgi:hypothetical protein